MTQPETSKKRWVTEERLVVAGADPGFASSGVVILERLAPDMMPTAMAAQVIRTEKAKKKVRGSLRVADDDARRYREIWAGLDGLYDEFQPHALGVEVFQPGFKSKSKKGGQAGGTAGAVKSMAVYGGTIFWALSRGMFMAPFLPADVKRRFCGKLSASKQDVISEMCQLVANLEEVLAGVIKSQREHVADAAGHAFLVLEEIDKTKKMLGLV